MILWILFFSALAWTSRCEPPVNSYLPPNGPNDRPSSEYGPPGATGGRGKQSGFGGLGNRNQPGFRGTENQNEERIGSENLPQDSYLPPGQRPQNNLDTQYGPPSGQTGRGGFDSQQGFGSQQLGFTQGQGNRKVPNSEYGTPGQGGRQGSTQGSKIQAPFGNSGRGQAGRLQSTYGPPNRDANLRGGSPSNGFGSSDFGNTPQSSYGPPPVGGVQGDDNKFGSRGSAPINSFGSTGQGLSDDFGSQKLTQAQRPGTSPDSSYGPPPSFGNSGGFTGGRQDGQGGAPSSSYGAPDFGGASAGQGSRGPGSNFNEEESDEPVKYEFSYDVDDFQTGTKFGHTEQRDGDTATGEYNVVLPDGRKQVVQYEAGLQGFKPQIRYEGGSGGSGSGFSGANAGRQRSNQGYSREQPGSSFSGSDNSLGHLQGLIGPPGSLDQGAHSSLVKQDTEGYPSGGPSGSRSQGGRFNDFPRDGPGQEQGYPSERPGANGFGNLNSGNNGNSRRGPQGNKGGPRGRPGQNEGFQGQQQDNGLRNLNQGASMGYPSGGPSSGRGFQDGFGNSNSQGDDRGYANGGPQGGRGFKGGLSQGSDSGYSGRPQSGTDFSRGQNPQAGGFGNNQRGNEAGYQSGGPQGRQGSGSGRQTGRGRGQQGGEEGYPSGAPDGPRGTGY